MTKPSERDREMARGLLTSVPWGHETHEERINAVARAISAAREEGRREERARVAKIVKWFADDERLDQWGTASLILQQIEDPLHDPAT